MTNLLILICTIISIKLTISQSTLPRRDLRIVHNQCSFYYDVDNQANVGPYTIECSSGSPCNCDGGPFDHALLDDTKLASTWFQLSNNSWLDINISLGDAGTFYKVSEIVVGWKNASQLADDTKSYISVLDPNTNSWTTINKIQSIVGGTDVTRFVCYGTDLTDTLVDIVHVHIEWNTPTPDGLIRPAYFTVDASEATKTPTEKPTKQPSKQPTLPPTNPSLNPSIGPTTNPSLNPTADPTYPTLIPSTSMPTTSIPTTSMPTSTNHPTTSAPAIYSSINGEWMIKEEGLNCFRYTDLDTKSSYFNIYCQRCSDDEAGINGKCFKCGTLEEPNHSRTDCDPWWLYLLGTMAVLLCIGGL